MKTVLGIFSDYEDASRAIDVLRDLGYKPKDFSIVMKDREQAQRLSDDSGATIADSAMTGVATGAAIGGLAGLLVGIGAIAIPGVGALLVGGPLAAALGLTGAAATTVSGAATGAIAGGLLGALMGLGLSRDEAEMYEQRVREGGILLAVPVPNARAQEVSDVMRDYNCTDIKSIDADDAYEVPDRNERSHEEPVQSQTHHHDTASVQRYLLAVDFPATKDDLIETAEQKGADEDVIETLSELPEVEFESPNEVKRAINHMHH